MQLWRRGWRRPKKLVSRFGALQFLIGNSNYANIGSHTEYIFFLSGSVIKLNGNHIVCWSVQQIDHPFAKTSPCLFEIIEGNLTCWCLKTSQVEFCVHLHSSAFWSGCDLFGWPGVLWFWVVFFACFKDVLKNRDNPIHVIQEEICVKYY